jgi:hypothetical protein
LNQTLGCASFSLAPLSQAASTLEAIVPIFLQAEAAETRTVSVEYSQPAGPIDRPVPLKLTQIAHCVPAEGEEIVVCGRQDNEQYRLRPLPPPPNRENVLSRPLRIKLMPGVTFGLQPGGGVGLRAEFGPGIKKSERGQVQTLTQ